MKSEARCIYVQKNEAIGKSQWQGAGVVDTEQWQLLLCKREKMEEKKKKGKWTIK